MIIDSDDDVPPAQSAPQAPPEADFEEEEEELDPDHPYPSIIQQLRLSLNTQVLHIAVPQIPTISAVRPADSIPAIFGKKIVFAVTCADYGVRVITLPLSPPSDAAKEAPFSPKSQWGEEIVKVPTHAGHQSIPRGIAMTWTSRSEPTFDEDSGDEMNVDADENTDAGTTPGRRRARRKQSRSRSGHRAEKGWDLLVASHSTELGGLLKIWRFGLTETSIAAITPIAAYQTLSLRKLATQVVFNSAQYPKRRHSQLLITDASGNARIYDPFAPRQASRTAGTKPEPGNYVALFRTTFEHTKSNSPTPPVLAARKPILDAAWASDGHHILALLADGEWGIWDVGRTGPSPPSDPSAFSIRGFVVTSESSRSGGGPSSPKTRNGRTSLAPMTPNTRRTKGESLFHGVSTSSSIPNHGGVSVASLPSVAGGASEDSVVIWYGSEVFRIPNLEKFLSRTASGSANGGSLPAPGLSPLQGIALHGEAITSVNQLDTTFREARLAIPRDVLISTDHRIIITVNTTQSLGRDLNAAFAKEQADEAEARKTDQALLARGELDLGGMGRLLEDMEGSGSASAQRSMVIGNPRKVLFASSTT